jgi:hypothetical protein
MADVCGRGYNGIYCALSNGASFGPVILVTPLFSDANGWNAAGYYSTIHLADVNGDGRADICGRAADGIYCALSTGSRNNILLPSFEAPVLWTGFFSDGLGWNATEYYSTIVFADTNNDHKADVCGRGPLGVMCARSSGTEFGPVTNDGPAFSDANGWNRTPAYYRTIRFPDLNGDGIVAVCGRGTEGIWCNKF